MRGGYLSSVRSREALRADLAVDHDVLVRGRDPVHLPRGRQASRLSNAGQKTSAMTAMSTIISTLATRVAFHAIPGRIVSALVLTVVLSSRLHRASAMAAGSAVVHGTSRG